MKSPKKKYDFKVSYTTDIPRRIGRGQDGDPIHSPISEKSWSACLKYFEEVERFLAQEKNEPPSLKQVVATLPQGSIVRVEVGKSKDVFGPKALVSIKDGDRPTEQRSPRIFDPVFVPLLLMMTAPGGSLRFNDTKGKNGADGNPIAPDDRRLFVSFGRGAEQNIRVLRIIYDPKAGEQVHRVHRKLDPLFHYDHRKSALVAKSDDSVRGSGQSAGFSRKGRSAAINVAGEHYDKAVALRGANSVDHIAKTRGEFKRILKWALRLADDLHKALVDRRRTK